MWGSTVLKGMIHIHPIDDIKSHFQENCWCQPYIEENLVAHNSADERELYEQGIRKPH